MTTTNRGSGFENFIATNFNGTSQYVQGSSSIAITDSNGRDSFAIEAWFKADSVNGWRTLFSNTENNRGFSLKINNGRLRGLVRFRNGSQSISEEIWMDSALPDLQTGRWYYAVLHVRENVDDNRFELRLHLDGEQVAYKHTSSRWNGVYQSVERPIVGAEPTGGIGDSHFFHGQIYAVTVSNYAIYLNNYVRANVVRDGSRYFGLGSYHDYLTTRAGMGYRMHQTAAGYPDIASKVVNSMVLPFMDDGYVPQGTAYDPDNDRFYVSMHWRNNAGATGAFPSIVAEITGDGDLRRVFQLKRPNGTDMTGHVGGIAFYNGDFYIPFGTAIYRYSLSTAPNPGYIFNPQTFANPRGDQNPLIPVATYSPNLSSNTGMSNLDIQLDMHGDPILWTSQFHASQTGRRLLGYRVNSDGSVNSQPIENFSLPVSKVQGITPYGESSTHYYFFLSTSYGDNPSVLYACRFPKGGTGAQNLSTAFTGPAGMEDVTMAGNQVWTNSESGARYYQKRTDGLSTWEDLYPMLYGMSITSGIPLPPSPPAASVIIDNSDSDFIASSNWWVTNYSPGYYGTDYHARATELVSDAAVWRANLPTTGTYKVYARWTAGTNRASAATYIVDHANGSTPVVVNQQQNNGTWVLLGSFDFNSGLADRVRLSCWTTSGDVVIADAVRFDLE